MNKIYKYILALLLTTSMAFSINLSTTAAKYKQLDDVSMNIKGNLSNNKDWIGIYKPGTNNSWGNVLAWSWVDGKKVNLKIDTIKDKSINLKKGKTYEARLFFNNSYANEASTRFQIIGAPSEFTVKNANPKAGDIINIHVKTQLTGHQDWIGIYPKNSDNRWSNVVAWNWVSKNGTVSLLRSEKNLIPGEYEARLFFNNSYKVEERDGFVVEKNDNNEGTISTVKEIYKTNETVSVNVNKELSGNKDWIGIYPKGSNNSWSNVIAWNWVLAKGTTKLSTKVQNKTMPAGEYETRLFFNNSYRLEASDGFIVKDKLEPNNHAPVATAQAVIVKEDTVDNAIILAGTDVDEDPLTYLIVTQPEHGVVTIVGSRVKYTPTANYAGVDTFSFKVNDGKIDSVPATVTITVTDVAEPNHAPVATAQAVIVKEDTVDNAIILAGTDVDEDPLTYLIVTQPEHGVVTIVGSRVKYTPTANYAGVDTFSFKVNDGKIDSVPATVTITVTDVEEETIEEKIVKRHNIYRRLEFQDSDLIWDATLAEHAQQWADYLVAHYTAANREAGQSPHASQFNQNVHGLPYLEEGENIAWSNNGRGYLTPNPVDITIPGAGNGGSIDAWANEKANYDYVTNATTDNTKAVGHYTQMVWQKTTKVGCGKASGADGEYVVCRYSIAGNLVGTKPYCTEYSVGQYYNNNALVFTNGMINNQTFDNTKILEDRKKCRVSDLTTEKLVINDDGTGVFQHFDFFNNGDYVTNFNFTKNIDAQGVLHMTGDVNGNNAVMTLKLIGEDVNYYNIDAEWTLDSNHPGYTRRAIFRLPKNGMAL